MPFPSFSHPYLSILRHSTKLRMQVTTIRVLATVGGPLGFTGSYVILVIFELT